MAGTAEDFIMQFHNLEGNTIKERKKTFFKLLQKENLFANEEQLNIALKNFQPKTYLESLFYIDALIFFKKTTELLEILKQGNEVYISKIVKQPWFFEEEFCKINIEELIDEFFPCISFSIRMKVLKRLSMVFNENQMDELFDLVLKQYGVRIASNILHACSSSKITEILTSYEFIILRPHQVKHLFDKDLNTFKFYLDCYKNNTENFYSEPKVIEYIALKRPEIVCELKTLRYSRLGRRTSKKVVFLIKDEDIIKNVDFYGNLINRSVMVRKLGNNFKDLYLNLFPKRIECIRPYDLSNTLLAYYPKKRRWDLFTQTFAQVFENKNVMDYISNLDSSIVKLCRDKEIVRKWAEFKYNETNNNKFLKYFEVMKALSVIKEKLNVTSLIYDRSELLNLMVDTCVENESLSALENVLEYFCFRHRNEEIRVRKSFLQHINHNCQLENFTEKHWQYINEQIKILIIKKEFTYYEHIVFIRKYLEFLFKNGKDFKDTILQFIDLVVTANRPFLLELKNPPIERDILTQLLNFVPNTVNKENTDFNKICTLLTIDVINFSKRNRYYYINLLDFQFLVDYIRSVFDKTENFSDSDYNLIENVFLYSSMFQILLFPKEKFIDLILIPSVKQYSFQFMNLVQKLLTHFIRNEPETISLYTDKMVTKDILDIYANLLINHRKDTLCFKEIKSYSHFNFDVTFIEFYKKQLSNPECDHKESIMKCLSYLDSTDGFVAVVTEMFLPKKEKLDLNDREMQEFYNLQCTVVELLKNVEEPFKMLPVVIKFCVGDYLKFALRSLYSICYRSPQKHLPSYLDLLSKKAVSVRKHAIFLCCELLDYGSTLNILKSTCEKNVSSKKYLYLATLKYFLKNPSPELFDLVVSNMHTIDKSDSETLEKLTVVKVPNKYKVVYLERCWDFYESLREKEINVREYLGSLLRTITNSHDVLMSLSSKFCKHIINSYFKEQKYDLHYINDFTCKILRYRETEQIENFNLVFEIISTFKNNSKRSNIEFFHTLRRTAAFKKIDRCFVNICIDYFGRTFTPIEMFDVFILFKLLYIKCNSLEPFIENYAKNVVKFLDQIVAEYGLLVYDKLKSSIREDLNFKEIKDKYLFFYNILKFKITPLSCILVLDLLPKVDEDDSKEVKEIFQNILQILQHVEEPVVKIYYNSYAKEG